MLNPLGWLRWLWDCLRGWWHPVPASRIEPGLWMAPRPTVVPDAIDCVFNVSEQQDAAAILKLPIGRYIWQPIHDGKFPGIAWLDRQVHHVTLWRQRNLNVLVHCTEGQSRSGLVVIGYLLRTHGWSLNDALDYAQSRRPVCRPNPAFIAGLAKYEQWLKETRTRRS